MNNRERRYHQSKRLQKYLRESALDLGNKLWVNLFVDHIAGTECYLEDGKVKVRALTTAECLEFENNPPENYTIQRYEP